MMRKLAVSCFATLLGLGAGLAHAADKPANFPVKPIELVVVYPAGGGMDVTARTLGKAAESILGHSFRVANRAGGGGMIGHAFMAKEAKADGYTVGILAMAPVFLQIISKNAPFGRDDFDPIGFINFEPYVLMTRGESFAELMEKAKKEGPNSVRTSVVTGSLSTLLIDFIEKHQGVKLQRVPFQGGKPSLLGLLNGTVDMAIGYFTEGDQYFRSGKARPAAVADTEPHAKLPDTPTLTSLGVPVGSATFGAARFIELPVGVPADVRAYLEQSFVKVLQDESTKAAFAKLGLTVRPYDAKKTSELYGKAFDTVKELTAQAKQ
ncbi:MAG: tripartite tricarboxylate transporter substrate binding protein [Burkholderiales bacterium]|nr:MAG: tripartite tricarboxylate transporter substrate binding protein [Burkholderiales bacterium]